jgi:threonine synthase
MRFVTTRGRAPAASLEFAIFDGLAPDGGLYVPESLAPWTAEEIQQLSARSLTELAIRTLRPFVSEEIGEATLGEIARDALNFPIPLVEVETGIFALELFHGPTLAFKDVGARVMARVMAALHDGGDPTTVLVATSGDTGGAVAHAFYHVPHMRVVVLYPAGRVSPTQEAQLTMFNGERGSNVRAYAVDGSFDDCQRLVKSTFADEELLRRVRLTSANSINIGRLLPQMIYYFHAVAQTLAQGFSPATGVAQGVSPNVAQDLSPAKDVAQDLSPAIISVPSGNFGNLTAGLMAKRVGLPSARFVAATNVNAVVPAYLSTGRFEPRASIQTIANAMDVGNPSNFERMVWLYGGDLDAMRRDIVGSRHDDDEVRATIRRVYDERGYLLDPHSAIAYLGLRDAGPHDVGRRGVGPHDVASGSSRTPRIFLATAHPAKFAEIVEPIIGRPIAKPAALADAVARPRHVLRVDATRDAVAELLRG